MLTVTGLSGGYPAKRILHQLNFTMNQGEILCLLGPNGCGKTTLMKAIMGFLPELLGNIEIQGQSLKALSPRERARHIAYIPQAHTSVFDYQVFEMVLMGRSSHISLLGQPSQKDLNAAFEALEELNIGHLAHQKYVRLSGGQRQLVLIARALAQQAQLIIMDEPSSDLDFANQQRIMDMLIQLKNKGISILLSTHAPEFPFQIADRVMLLREGRILALGTPEEVLTPEWLQGLYNVPMDVVKVTDRQGNERRLCLALPQTAPQ